MLDIIQLLPDSVANQIAAGEVIQRPASVVKELVENAIDAGAKKIKVVIKDSGRTLIQVIDDGKGMSTSDARLAFERHATSKIREAKDLFEIKTMGFRGEALASIAAVAMVELKTRQESEELGNHIVINGSEIEKQEFISCPEGSNFSVKNLFFNIPARRRFLKSEQTEFRHILTQFQRIVLCYPEISFSLVNNGVDIYNLPIENYHKRIVRTFGSAIQQNLIPINTETSLVKISGFIGKAQNAKKHTTNQYFFVNQRFMRHPYFHKAIMMAYSNILQTDTQPTYFLYLDMDPDKIDINIHPTKTEIKFEDSPAIFQILRAATKESLGKYNIIPSIDFDQEGAIDIPVLTKNTIFNSPKIGINPNFNPFEEEKSPFSKTISSPGFNRDREKIENWEKLYEDIDKDIEESNNESSQLFVNQENTSTQTSNIFQIKNKYIVTPVKSGLMIINQKRAHERILFENFIANSNNKEIVSQTSLFPEAFNLELDECAVLNEINEHLFSIGFDIKKFGTNSFVINATPSIFDNIDTVLLIKSFIENFRNTELDVKSEINEKIAISMAKAASINYSSSLTPFEMRSLIDQLFSCSMPNFSPTGKTIIQILKMEDIEKLF
ncbi:MAG: DNA mismatch repair endonuclease MutL [Bacteroidales bacterium]|nr:DNA mismatch repair endonuclease MutL [Bacteroidales bacterium]MBN2756144.1 DNA mismatch repair endonuclease MutL [Bacteroidales bacterium]